MRRAAAVLAPTLGAGLIVAACGPSTSSPPAALQPSIPAVACRPGAVHLTVAQTLRLSCGAGVRAAAAGTVLSRVGPFAFLAVRAGTATVTLVRGATCSPGTLCPDYLAPLGDISVTVGAASASP